MVSLLIEPYIRATGSKPIIVFVSYFNLFYGFSLVSGPNHDALRLDDCVTCDVRFSLVSENIATGSFGLMCFFSSLNGGNATGHFELIASMW